MVKALVRFHIGLYKMGAGVMVWIGVLVLVNAIIPLYFWPATPAVVSLIVFLTGFALMILLTHFFGFTRILGLGHFLWIPLVVYMLSLIDFNQLIDPVNLWMGSLIICNTISLAIDIADVARYVKGDCDELVSLTLLDGERKSEPIDINKTKS